MSRTTKIVGFSVPAIVLDEIESFAREERRTKSELFREMVRVYRRYRDQRDRDEERWVMNVIQEARAEQAQRPMPTEELLKQSTQLSRYGAQQAKRTGIKPKNISGIIHERRKARRS